MAHYPNIYMPKSKTSLRLFSAFCMARWLKNGNKVTVLQPAVARGAGFGHRNNPLRKGHSHESPLQAN